MRLDSTDVARSYRSGLWARSAIAAIAQPSNLRVSTRTSVCHAQQHEAGRVSVWMHERDHYDDGGDRIRAIKKTKPKPTNRRIVDRSVVARATATDLTVPSDRGNATEQSLQVERTVPAERRSQTQRGARHCVSPRAKKRPPSAMLNSRRLSQHGQMPRGDRAIRDRTVDQFAPRRVRTRSLREHRHLHAAPVTIAKATIAATVRTGPAAQAQWGVRSPRGRVSSRPDSALLHDTLAGRSVERFSVPSRPARRRAPQTLSRDYADAPAAMSSHDGTGLLGRLFGAGCFGWRAGGFRWRPAGCPRGSIGPSRSAIVGATADSGHPEVSWDDAAHWARPQPGIGPCQRQCRSGSRPAGGRSAARRRSAVRPDRPGATRQR